MNKKITCFTDSASVKIHPETALIEIVLCYRHIEAEHGKSISGSPYVFQEANVDLSGQGGYDKIQYCLIEYLKQQKDK